MIACCPNCGFSLDRLETLQIGPLEIRDNAVGIFWLGEKVALPPARRLLVDALARGGGHVLKQAALIEAIGGDNADDPGNLLAVQVCKTRKAFRFIDRSFDRIETESGIGYRWRK